MTHRKTDSLRYETYQFQHWENIFALELREQLGSDYYAVQLEEEDEAFCLIVLTANKSCEQHEERITKKLNNLAEHLPKKLNLLLQNYEDQ